MVIIRTIENLRERPHHERRRFAALFSIAIVVILFAGWALYFFHKIGTSNTPTNTTVNSASQPASLNYVRGQ